MNKRFPPILQISHKQTGILSTALAVLFLLALSACKERVVLDTFTPAMDRNLPDEVSSDVRISQLDGDRIEYILEAKKIERFYDRKMLHGWDVTITSYDPAGRIRSTIKADTTIVDDARNIIYTNGNVLMKSENGSISTRRIIWDRNLDEIVAPERVVLTRDGSVLKGTNLRTNSTISFAELEAVEAEGLFDEKDLDW